jgi:2-keto-4-pentenoate hydratase
MNYDPEPAAAALREVRLKRGLVLPLPAAIAPRTEQEGAAAQFALARLAGAVPCAGFKIGATGKRMQEYLGLAGPAAGFMHAGTVFRGDGTVRFADCIKPGVECEVAVRLARDLPPGSYTKETVAGAVGEFVAGIEIVENRYDDLKTLGTPTLIADQVYHVAAVLGEQGRVDWRALDIGSLRGRISIDGVERDAGVTSDLMGHPFTCLAFLASSPVAAAFGGLKAGQCVMLGSVTPPVWLDGPAHVTVEFAGLPAVSARLS